MAKKKPLRMPPPSTVRDGRTTAAKLRANQKKVNKSRRGK